MDEQYKSGFVTLIGRPNVGKSTLMNHLIGQKIAITSNKPQTTRNRIQTVYTCEKGQIVFVDTPGIHKAKNKLGEYMVNVAERTVNEVDAVLWLVEPILQLGLATALLGCWPALAPLHRACSLCAATLAGCLNRWALWVSGWPGAQIYFDTACAALVCLLLLGLGWLAYHWRVRPRVALPCLVLTAALAIGLGNVLNREIVRVELAGSRNAPAVVITRGESAVVLFRGGSSTQQAVETLLTRRGAREVEMLVDLRMNPRTPCTLEARERMAADEMPRYTTRRAHSSPAELEVLRVQNGCIVRITAAGRQFAALSGSVQLAKPVRVDWLLASPARPDAVQYTDCLTLSSAYRWMEENVETETASCLALRPGGGERLS